MTTQERDEIVALLHDEHDYDWSIAEWCVDECEDTIDSMSYDGYYPDDIARGIASKFTENGDA